MLIDADRVKTGQVASQLFEMIAWGAPASPYRSSHRRSSGARGRVAFRDQGGMFLDRLSSMKNARSHASRKLTIMSRSQSASVCTTLWYQSLWRAGRFRTGEEGVDRFLG